MSPHPFRFLGLDPDGRPVLLRLVAAEPVPVPPAAGPLRIGAAWLALLDMPCPPAPVEVVVGPPFELVELVDAHLDALALDEHLDALAELEADRLAWARLSR